MKRVATAFALLVTVITILITGCALIQPKVDLLAVGNFFVLSLTLVVLVWYAHDTHVMAKLTQERWMRDAVLSTTYEMSLLEEKQIGRTLFRIHIPGTLVVRAKVSCNLKVYGQPVHTEPLYDGRDVWLVFPQQMSQGWFDIQALIKEKGKDIATMLSETTPENRKQQFTMDLELEFSDELGGNRKLPRRHHYFDFERWAWIPQLSDSRS